MNQTFQALSAQTLRTLMLSEAKKFVHEMERGATLPELEAIQANMKEIADALAAKEREESILRKKK